MENTTIYRFRMNLLKIPVTYREKCSFGIRIPKIKDSLAKKITGMADTATAYRKEIDRLSKIFLRSKLKGFKRN